MSNFYLNYRTFLNAKNYEPMQRRYAGSKCPVWVCHRFPIKGGISLREVMVRSFACNSVLTKGLFEAKGAKIGETLRIRLPQIECASHS